MNSITQQSVTYPLYWLLQVKERFIIIYNENDEYTIII